CVSLWRPRVAFSRMKGGSSAAEHPIRYAFCGEGSRNCLDAAREPWREVQEAAEAAYDRTSECRFTSFVAYEWSLTPGTTNLHRNVIFRNATVPELPTSALDETTPEGLWAALHKTCLDAGTGCDVLAIPHNSNLSAGRMFRVEDLKDRDAAATPGGAEPLVEIIQHKGDSECIGGIGETDEQCGFEKLPYDRFGGKYYKGLLFAPVA